LKPPTEWETPDPTAIASGATSSATAASTSNGGPLKDLNWPAAVATNTVLNVQVENREQLIELLERLHQNDPTVGCTIELHLSQDVMIREFDLGHLTLVPDGWQFEIPRLIELVKNES